MSPTPPPRTDATRPRYQTPFPDMSLSEPEIPIQPRKRPCPTPDTATDMVYARPLARAHDSHERRNVREIRRSQDNTMPQITPIGQSGAITCAGQVHSTTLRALNPGAQGGPAPSRTIWRLFSCFICFLYLRGFTSLVCFVPYRRFSFAPVQLRFIILFVGLSRAPDRTRRYHVRFLAAPFPSPPPSLRCTGCPSLLNGASFWPFAVWHVFADFFYRSCGGLLMTVPRLWQRYGR